MTLTKKILSILVFGTLIFEISRFYSFVENYSSWQYADWLINYQGGLVRRGFIGEILYLIHKFFFIDLDILIFVFVSFIYISISFFLIKSIKYIENNYLNILIFLSPGFFIYPVMNSGIIGRKDILFIFIISFLVFFEKKLTNRFLFFYLILSLIIVCLSHSGFVFYSPYLIFLYFLIKDKRNLKIKKNEIFTIPLIILLIVFFIQYFSGSETLINTICLSVKNFVSDQCGKSDQIFHLATDLQYRLSEKKIMGMEYLFNYFTIYLLSIFLVFYFISNKFIKSKFDLNNNIAKNLTPFTIIVLLFIFTLPVYIIGRDWGRYIYISYSCTFFIYIYCLKEKILIFKDKNYMLKKINKFSFFILVIFYSFLWTFPYYDASNFKFTLKKPVKSLFKKIN